MRYVAALCTLGEEAEGVLLSPVVSLFRAYPLA